MTTLEMLKYFNVVIYRHVKHDSAYESEAYNAIRAALAERDELLKKQAAMQSLLDTSAKEVDGLYRALEKAEARLDEYVRLASEINQETLDNPSAMYFLLGRIRDLAAEKVKE